MPTNLLQLCQDHQQYVRHVYEVQGILFAVASSPEIPLPNQWLAWILIDPQNTPENVVENCIDPLMCELKSTLAHMRDNDFRLPVECEYHNGLIPESPLSLWMTGLLWGHTQLQPVWQHCWQAMQNKAPELAVKQAKSLSQLLRLFSTFANVPLALEQAIARGNDELEQQLPVIADTLPRAINEYTALANGLVSFVDNQFEQE